MPVRPCTRGGKAGNKWGNKGKCYTGKGSRKKALAQGRAIHASKKKH